MGYNATVESQYRTLPAIHRLLELPSLRAAVERHGRPPVMAACRSVVDGLRRDIAAGAIAPDEVAAACDAVEELVLDRLDRAARAAYPELVNATGVLIHTNLGRSPLPVEPLSRLGSYLALEYDLEAGGRGQRLAPLRERIAAVCSAEAAVMVNNNAAALLLILSAHARGRQVIVSRGQLIEIGGSFRLPEVMAASGCHLVEVGCTNRTHLRDFAAAIGDDTAALMVAHHSNFRIVGFTAEPTVAELAALAHERGLPLIVDQGSGCLHDLRRWGLAGEPTVAGLLADGADLVCFSGDKLLGGPQAGVVVGRSEWVEPLGRHPLYRALRPDKTALALMDRVLAAHASGRLEDIPLYRLLATTTDELDRRARALVRRLRRRSVQAARRASRATVGGGTTPDRTVPSVAVGVPGGAALEEELRRGEPAVVARIEDNEVRLDLRAVPAEDDGTLAEVVAAAYHRLQTRQDSGR